MILNKQGELKSLDKAFKKLGYEDVYHSSLKALGFIKRKGKLWRKK